MGPLSALTRAVLATVIFIGAFPASVHATDPAEVATIDFDWTGYVEVAPGSDNWPLTWCEDDHQYTSWGDGGGFGGTNTDGRDSLGFARVEGPYATFTGTNLWGGKDPVSQSTFNGKVQSIFCIGGNLYAWRSPSSAEGSFEFKQLVVSYDKGVTWLEEAFPASRVDGVAGGPGIPYTINYGQNNTANTDGFVYTYWIEILDPAVWEVQIPGTLWLTRAPAANEAFADAANWEWYGGMNAGAPIWTTQANRAAVLVDPEGMLRGNAIYVPGIGQYLMTTNHTARNSGGIAVWQAYEPWGPWTLVRKEYDWPADDPESGFSNGKFTFGVFSPKWFSVDGMSGVMVFFRPDSWNSVPFTLPEPSLWLGLAAGGLLVARSSRRR